MGVLTRLHGELSVVLFGGWSKEKQGREKWWVHKLEIFGKAREKGLPFLDFWYPAHDIKKLSEPPKRTQQKQRRARAQNCAHNSPFVSSTSPKNQVTFIGSAAL
jgi:hypothetical protein